MGYEANEGRYQAIPYRRCGKSGLQLPALSLGLWHNFGGFGTLENAWAMMCTAFDLGITHFDLANNYGPPPGSAELAFGQLLKRGLAQYRDEMIISTKAGYPMWPGPYGNWGSKKYLTASLDQSLRRMDIDYVDIFYHHRPDPETPIQESMEALAHAVHSGKALYIGLSNYQPDQAAEAFEALRQIGVKCLIHQPKYSMLERSPENGLFDLLEREGVGAIAFCPLAQGVLTDKYLEGIPEDSRAANPKGHLQTDDVRAHIGKVRRLAALARERGQSMAQMALCWALRKEAVTSALIGASRPEQICENVAAMQQAAFTEQELLAIEAILQA